MNKNIYKYSKTLLLMLIDSIKLLDQLTMSMINRSKSIFNQTNVESTIISLVNVETYLDHEEV